MVGNLLIVRITRPGNGLIAAALQDCFRKFPHAGNAAQAGYIFPDFLCCRCGKHARIGTRIGDKLFFIQLLCNPKRLVRADFEKFRACILKFGQIIKKRRVFHLFFLSR